MIADILRLLREVDYEGNTEVIKAAKGKYEQPDTFMEVLRHVKDRTHGRR